MSVSRWGLVLVSAGVFVGCGSLPKNSSSVDRAPYFESNFDDRNRAPASMAPQIPVSVGDPVYMQTQADQCYLRAEAFSMEGQSRPAIEELQNCLVYDPESAHLRFRLATEYYKLGMLSESMAQAEQSLQKDPKQVEARLLLGGLYSHLRSFDKAIAQYQEVIKLSPDNTEAPMFLGAIYAELQKHDEAVKYLDSLARNPENQHPHIAYYLLGRIQSERKGFAYQKSAEEFYKKSLSKKANYVEAAMALAALYSNMKQEQKGIDFLAQFQKDNGPSARVSEYLANKFLEQEKFELALENLKTWARFADDVLNVQVKIALVHIELKNYEQAVQALTEVLKEAPDSDKIRFYLAAVYEEINQDDNAIKHFKLVPKESQFYSEAVIHSALLLKKQKDIDGSLSIVTTALQNRPDVPQFYALKASLLDEQKKHPEALALLTEAVEKFPDNTQVRFYLGSIHDRMGNKDLVISTMKELLEMDPQHVQGLNYLAFTYADLNQNLDKAEELARKALSLESKDGYIMDTLGWVLFKKGRWNEAVKYLEAAHVQEPQESIIAEHLGDAYLRLNLVEKAHQMYRHAAQYEKDEDKLQSLKEKISAIEIQKMPASLSDRAPASEP